MKALKNLIKLHKKHLDDLLIQISKLEEKKTQLSDMLENILSQAQSELQLYSGSEYVFMLDSYIKDVDNKKRNMTTQISNLSSQILLLREELMENFSELKKFEIALNNRISARQKQLKKEEIKFIDEFNVTKFATTTEKK